jgi:hypothetical protein
LLVVVGASTVIASGVALWTVADRAQELSATAQKAEDRDSSKGVSVRGEAAGSPPRAEGRLKPVGDLSAEALATKQRCIQESKIQGISPESVNMIVRACEEVARGGETKTAQCILDMRTMLLTTANPTTLLSACGVKGGAE